MKRLLLYNAVPVVIFYGLWVWGWHTEPSVTKTIDRVALCLWFPAFYAASFFALRRRSPKAALKSLASAAAFFVGMWLLLMCSLPAFDPWF
jgi:hypothetical protein